MRAKKRHSGKGNAAPPSRRALDVRRALVTFAAFVAIFAQAFIVQTHVHFDGEARSPSAFAQVGNGALAPGQTELRQAFHLGDDREAFCEICQTLATAGAAVLGTAPTWVATVAEATDEPRAEIARILERRAFSWQSRAPPIPL